MSDSEIFETDSLWGYFEGLRNQDAVHCCAESEFGPYWCLAALGGLDQGLVNPGPPLHRIDDGGCRAQVGLLFEKDEEPVRVKSGNTRGQVEDEDPCPGQNG